MKMMMHDAMFRDARRASKGWALAAVALLALAGPTTAQTPEEAPWSAATSKSISERFPPGSVKSVAIADAVLVETAKERAAIETRFDSEQRACQSRFFVTSCMEAAKEDRREALTPLRVIEIEANLFKRQDRAQQRELARQRRAAEAAQRKRTAVLVDRGAQHEARLEQIRQREEEEQKMRAENVAAYEERMREHLERQAEIESSTAAKEAQRHNERATNDKVQ